MTEKLCGPCSIEQGLSKEERIEIAKSRIPNEVYRCPICNKEHSYQVQVREKTSIPSNEVVKKTSLKKTKKKSNDPKQVQEQLQLF